MSTEGAQVASMPDFPKFRVASGAAAASGLADQDGSPSVELESAPGSGVGSAARQTMGEVSIELFEAPEPAEVSSPN